MEAYLEMKSDETPQKSMHQVRQEVCVGSLDVFKQGVCVCVCGCEERGDGANEAGD